MPPSFTRFSATVRPEGAFTVLAVARRLSAAGKDVIELEIGDSPFPSPDCAVEAGIQAIRDGRTRYGPSAGLPEFRAAAAAYVNAEHGFSVSAENVVAGPGAKTFEQLFCEAFLEPDDGVLVFSPYFPTYPANIARRGARMVLSNLRAARAFRPDLDDVRLRSEFNAEFTSHRAGSRDETRFGQVDWPRLLLGSPCTRIGRRSGVLF